ncbi:MAG TPA: CFI-box-CTERM domain-containing protein, partial [Polyangiales bacterium]|nr:CFI-box-CTERM domain-containing protein [Polyangiales bacterium]
TVTAGDAGVNTPAASAGRAADGGKTDRPAAMSGNGEPPRNVEGTAQEMLARPGPVRDLELSKHEQLLHAHKWVHLRLRAVDSAVPLHAYEVRVATEPMKDETTFIRQGRQAKNASEAKEGPSHLQLPTDVPAGEWIDATIGDLYEQTHYYVGVRARNVNNQAGPIAFAEFTTPKREFATVSPCFIATVAYGSPLAEEVGVLRRLRDRYLLSNALGRALVNVYYRYGAEVASWVRPYPTIRRALRFVLAPLVALAEPLAD